MEEDDKNALGSGFVPMDLDDDDGDDDMLA